MITKEFTGTVQEITPTAVYDGRVYTQQVKIQTKEGTAISIFDRKKCGDDMIGRTVHFDLSVEIMSDIESDGSKIGIFHASDSEGPYADLCGIVEKITENESGTEFVLDVEEGSVQIKLTQEQASKFPEFDEGDQIYVSDANLHLDDIEIIG